MPISVTYATVNGVLVEENRNGSVTTYVSDTLGSVIKTVEGAGAVTSETTYWPYGEVRTLTGSNPSPWQFVGTLGYFKDATARIYVRARTYRRDVGLWLSVDSLWPRETAYRYCNANPVSATDSSGQQSIDDYINRWGKDFERYIKDQCRRIFQPPKVEIVPIYGNYCGPQTTAGTGEPISDTDRCCKEHDDCWREHNCKAWNQSWRATCRRCTHTLCDCFKKTECKTSAECAARNAFILIYCRQPFTNWPFPEV